MAKEIVNFNGIVGLDAKGFQNGIVDSRVRQIDVI